MNPGRLRACKPGLTRSGYWHLHLVFTGELASSLLYCIVELAYLQSLAGASKAACRGNCTARDALGIRYTLLCTMQGR